MAPRKQVTLQEAHVWFKTEILPKRTTSAGFSANRIVKSPRGLLMGNQIDPNGLCGDAAAYVWETFFDTFTSDQTSDGHQMVMVRWDGVILNHIAIIMVPKDKSQDQKYILKGDSLLQSLGKQGGKATFDKTSLFALPVYDLYYKKRTTLGPWWEDLDEGKDGSIVIATYSSISDI